MKCAALEKLKEEEFDASVGFLHTPAVVRSALQQSPDVKRLVSAIRFGEVTEGSIRQFVKDVTSEFSTGQRLPHDLALAALAVALEFHPADFAEEYLLDLARLHLAELSISINVARLCLRYRHLMPKHETRSYTYPVGTNRISPKMMVAVPRPMTHSGRPRAITRYPRHGAAC